MPFDSRTLVVTFFTALTIATGLAGCVLPVVPGLGLIFLAALVYGLLTGFGTTGVVVIVIMGVLFVAGSAAPYVLPQLTGRKTGASKRALFAGVVLGIVGFFVLPIVGALLGAILGVLLAEWAVRRSFALAWTATKGVIVGWGLGVLVQGTAGLLMTVAWVFWVVANLVP